MADVYYVDSGAYIVNLELLPLLLHAIMPLLYNYMLYCHDEHIAN